MTDLSYTNKDGVNLYEGFENGFNYHRDGASEGDGYAHGGYPHITDETSDLPDTSYKTGDDPDFFDNGNVWVQPSIGPGPAPGPTVVDFKVYWDDGEEEREDITDRLASEESPLTLLAVTSGFDGTIGEGSGEIEFFNENFKCALVYSDETEEYTTDYTFAPAIGEHLDYSGTIGNGTLTAGGITKNIKIEIAESK